MAVHDAPRRYGITITQSLQNPGVAYMPNGVLVEGPGLDIYGDQIFDH